MSEPIRTHIPDQSGRQDTVCDIEAYEIAVAGRRRHVVVVTERADNPGPSLINNAEGVVSYVRRIYGPGALAVAHYAYKAPVVTEGYDLLHLDENGGTSWRHLGTDLAAAFAKLADLATPIGDYWFDGDRLPDFRKLPATGPGLRVVDATGKAWDVYRHAPIEGPVASTEPEGEGHKPDPPARPVGGAESAALDLVRENRSNKSQASAIPAPTPPNAVQQRELGR